MILLDSVWLDWELTNNNNGQSKSWYNSANERHMIESYLLSEQLKRTQPYGAPTWIRITRVLGKGQRLWDMSSGLRGNSKQLIDAFVAIGWFVDDCPKYVKEVRFAQDSSQRQKGPSILFEVFAYED